MVGVWGAKVKGSAGLGCSLRAVGGVCKKSTTHV